MAHYYVKAGFGTRTTGGGYGSAQTGSFASLGATNVYDNFDAVESDGLAAGDFVYMSDLHDKDYGGTTTTIYAPVPAWTSAFITVISVDDVNCDQYKKGAVERTTASNADYYMRGRFRLCGVTIRSADRFTLISAHTIVRFEDGELQYKQLYYNDAVQAVELYDSDVTLTTVNPAGLYMYGQSGVFVWKGGTLNSAAGGDGLVDYFCTTTAVSGLGHIEISGVDLSIIDGSYIFNSTSIYGPRATLDMCKLHANEPVGFNAFSTGSRTPRVKMTRCSSSSAAAEYSYWEGDATGTIEDDTSFYRDGSVAFKDSSQKVSYKAVTDSDAARGTPFQFDLPSVWAALSSASTDTIRIHLLSATALTDEDVWAELVYPDGTNKHLGNLADSRTYDPFSSGTTLTTNTETWTGRTTENRYQIDLDTSGDAGADCVPIVRVYVSKASATIYFCPTVEVVA